MDATPIPAEYVGNAFVQQYYQIMHQFPEKGHKFYQEISKLGRPEENGSMSITTTVKAINEKIFSLSYGDFSTVIKTVDAQSSYNGGVHLLVTGYQKGKDESVRNFIQSFFLAPQETGFFVLNDMLRYVDNNATTPLVNDAAVPAADEPVTPPIEETKASKQSPPSVEECAEENGDVKIAVEVPEAEVVNKVPIRVVVAEEFNGKTQEVPKKSYVSVVMQIKKSVVSQLPSGPLRDPPKKVERVIQATNPDPDGPSCSYKPVLNGNHQEGEGHSIYIKGLPMNATEYKLEEAFKKFGNIKRNGIQLRSNRLQGFCIGFVEFEHASSVHKVLEVCMNLFNSEWRGFNSNKEEFYSNNNSNRGNGWSNSNGNNRGGANRGSSNYSKGGCVAVNHRNGTMINGSSATSKNNYGS